MATPTEREDELLRSVALQNASSILRARQRAERELVEAKEQLRETNERINHILDSITDGFIVLDSEFRFTYLNRKAEEMLKPVERKDESLVGRNFWEALPNSLGTEFESAYRRALEEQVTVELEAYYPPLARWFAVRAYPSRHGLAIYFQDVSRRKEAEASLASEKRVLEMIATGAPLEQVLDQLARETEAQSTEGLLCSVLVLDDVGEHLLHGAAPSLPQGYNEAIHGVRIGPSVGSCGTAAFEGRPVRVADIATDPLWSDFKDLAAKHGLGACFSTPILSSQGRVLGTIAMYYPEAREPSARDDGIIVFAAHLASIVIERMAAERRLRESEESERHARGAAEKASRMKDEFLATLSHELRTPLSAILGWSQVLRMKAMSPEELRRGLETIERNARMQTQLIEDLLDMSRITSGKVRLDVQSVRPASVIEASLETVRPAAEAKGIRLEKMLDPAAGPISADPSRLQQVIWNLVNNAIKFTPKGGKVQVLLERVNSHIEISVADTGAGIDPQFLEHVFERFRQADPSTTRQFGGLGLGLAIVKHLVELHGGTVHVKSAGANQGSTFTVILPLAVVQRMDDTQPRQHPVSPPLVAADLKAVDLSGVKVLVVDDQPDARELIARVLTECRAQVIVAATADEALGLVERERPDVLVSDIGMPGIDGFELLKRIRALGEHRGGKLPAIALTAFARSEDRTRALHRGFQVHVAKPVEPAELIATVASVAGRTGMD